jgi:hypothetical protein
VRARTLPRAWPISRARDRARSSPRAATHRRACPRAKAPRGRQCPGHYRAPRPVGSGAHPEGTPARGLLATAVPLSEPTCSTRDGARRARADLPPGATAKDQSRPRSADQAFSEDAATVRRSPPPRRRSARAATIDAVPALNFLRRKRAPPCQSYRYTRMRWNRCPYRSAPCR